MLRSSVLSLAAASWLLAAPPAKEFTRGQREFWSFRPLRPAAPGATLDSLTGWKGAPKADRITLLRRVTFDLTGLAPTELEVRAFLGDASPQAFARVVDRLLVSPRYGEHWGRHWLDVARYADSTGADEDHRYPHAWRYRDYVIEAFNRDLPYDQFIREQVAGDLLPPAEPGAAVNTRGIIATGFLALGPKLIAEQDKVKMFYDAVDEQIEVTGKAFLGLTLQCARCHDHKFDPIRTTDYYGLASIFASTKQWAKLEGTVSQLYFVPLVDQQTAGAWEFHKQKVEEKQKEIDSLVSNEQTRHRERHLPRLADYMLAAYAQYSGGGGAGAEGLDADVLKKWVEYLKPNKDRRPQLEPFYEASDKPAAARRFQAQYLAALEERRVNKDRKFLAGDDRFYTEVNAGPFALPKENREALFSKESQAKLATLNAELKQLKDTQPAEPPLACAVSEGDAVEQHVFVRGNPASKGELVPKRLPLILTGADQPPVVKGSGRMELAKWLASAANPLTPRVMANRIWGWHFGEGIVRTTANFGMVGDRPANPELLDWLARRFIDSGWSIKAMHRLILNSDAYQRRDFPTRRLYVEEMRDSLLAIDGSLDTAIGGTLQSGLGTDNEFAEARKSINPDTSKRRTVYLPLRRSNLSSVLNLFDFGDATTVCEGRNQSNVAPQALYMMNSPFIEERARTLAMQWTGDPAGRVGKAYWKILSRPATAAELRAGVAYAARFPGKPEQAWLSLARTLIASNEFLYLH